MKKWEQEAIRLKYEGKTYRQIADELSKLVGFTVTESTLKQCFMVDGRLYLDYLEYEVVQNQYTEETARQAYKKMASWVPLAEKQLYKEALKAKDFRLAWDILKNINDRAGIVVIRKSEVNVDETRRKPIETYEQFLAELKRSGIDPRTGLRMAKAEVGTN